MRKITLLTFIFALSASFAFGQLIKEGKNSMSKGTYNSLSMELRKTVQKDVLKEWEKFVKQYKGKVEKEKKSTEILANNSVIKAMGDNDLDIYADVKQVGENTELTVWFDLGGAFLSSNEHPQKYAVAENLIMDFALTVSKGILEDQLKEEEKVLKAFENEQKKLVKDKERYEKDIEDCKATITERENDIVKNKSEQKSKKEEIEAQMERVKAVKAKIDKLN